MSGDVENNLSAWTTETLKAHFDQRFLDNDRAVQAALVSQEKAVSAALVAAEKAVTKAEFAAEKRFDSVNEFRRTLADQTNTFIPRTEAHLSLDALRKEVDELKQTRAANEGQVKGSDVQMGKIYAAIGGVGAILAILVMLANGVFK